MVKYKQAIAEMWSRHQSEFEEFKKVHDEFARDMKTGKEELDRLGKPLLRIIEDEENRLCSKMEGSGRGNYASNLAEKFRSEVRKVLPLIDFVGVTIN